MPYSDRLYFGNWPGEDGTYLWGVVGHTFEDTVDDASGQMYSFSLLCSKAIKKYKLEADWPCTLLQGKDYWIGYIHVEGKSLYRVGIKRELEQADIPIA